MSSQPNCCPDETLIGEFLSGDLSAEVHSELETHFNDCESCQLRLEKSVDSAHWQQKMPEDRKLQIETATTALMDTQTVQLATESEPLQIPGYEILEKVDSGGMGVVYKAVQHSLKRTVALKVLRSTAIENPQRWLRFKTETEAIGRLQHANIVRVFDAGEHEGRAYVSQELCDAKSLAARMRPPQAPVVVATMIQQLADAVHHAHQQDVLHRDIKPSNILFLDGNVKLVDFGLAKLTDVDDVLTHTRDVMGSPSYMAPEQTRADHESIGPQTDIFQLGIVTYESLTGVAPFLADSAVESLRLTQEHEPVAPRSLQPGIPRDLQTICMKCLEKRPSDRYQSAAELVDDLEQFLSGHAIAARPPSLFNRLGKWAKRRPAMAALIVVSLAAAFGLLGIWAKFTSELSEQTRIAIDKTKAAQTSLEDALNANAAAMDVMDFFTVDLLDSANPDIGGANVKVVDVIDSASGTVETKFKDRPRVEAIIQTSIGNMYFKLGQSLKALPHMERGVELFEQIGEPVNQQSFVAQYQLAICLKDLQRYEEAFEIGDRIAPLAKEVGIVFELELRYFNLARILQAEGREAAVPYMEELNADCVRELGRAHSTSTNVRASLESLYLQTQDIQKARKLAMDDLRMFDEIGDEDHPSAASALNTLAILAVRQGDFVEAEKRHRDALRRRISSQGEGHSDTIAQKSNLAATIWRQGRHKEATDLLQEVIDANLQLLGPQDTRTLEATYQTLRMLLVMKGHEQGEKLADRVLGPQLSTRPATGQWASLLTAWAELKIHQQDLPRARELLNSARAVFDENPAAQNPSRSKAVDAAEKLLTKAKSEV